MSELRVRKVQEFIKQEVSQMLLHDLKDPRIGFVTVTEVKVTGDLREATIYVSLFGKPEEKKASLDALNKAAASCAVSSGSVSRSTTHRRSPFQKMPLWTTACILTVF